MDVAQVLLCQLVVGRDLVGEGCGFGQHPESVVEGGALHFDLLCATHQEKGRGGCVHRVGVALADDAGDLLVLGGHARGDRHSGLGRLGREVNRAENDRYRDEHKGEDDPGVLFDDEADLHGVFLLSLWRNDAKT